MRVLEDETRLNQRVLPIERHSIEKNHALRIDKYTHAFKVENVIVRARFGSKLELIAETGATAAKDSQAKSSIDTFTRESSTNFIHCLRRDEHLLGLSLFSFGVNLRTQLH